MRYISRKSFHKSVKYWIPGAATLALLPGIVFAQNTPSAESSPDPAQAKTFEPAVPDQEELPSEKATTIEEMVVTGTQMRGVAPTGTQLISVDIESIAATGAVTTAELMSTIPQNIGFGDVPSVAGGNNVQLTVNRINLRNLPQGIGAASPTLVLMDGHRLVGVGIGQNYPDPDVVPPGVLQRVEIMTEGGSSVYGADAIGGVVNFITRKDIDGAEVGVRQGFGDSYNSTDVNVSAGRDWGDTSAYAAYSFSQNDQIYGGDRNYVQKIDWTTGIPVDLACNPANVTIGADTWAVNPQTNTLTPGTANKCDTTQYDTIFPQMQRNSVFAGFTHDFNDRLQVELQSWFTKRDNTSDEGPLEGFATVSASNPNYISTGGSTGAATQNVGFNFAPINGNHQDQDTNLKEWGFTPTLLWDIGHEWQMRAYYNYGYSDVDFEQQEVDAVALNEAVAAGTLNPYNVVASDPSAIATVLNSYQTGRGEQELNNVKAVFDGPIYQLPGGQVHVAAGAEYLDEYYKGGTLTDANGIGIPYVNANRDVNAWFAEINIPIVGDGNQMPGIYEITIAASYRYDDYSDFGSTDSPNYAFTYKPLEWLSFRGRYNEAFQAPGLADLANANSTVTTFPFIPGVIVNPAVPVQPGQWLLAAQGTKLPLEPQTAQNYNVGFDIDVPYVEGLTIGASYYHIEYEGQISIPPIYNPGVFYANFPNNYIMLPSADEAGAFLLGAGVPQGDVDNALAQVGNNPIYATVDVRRINQGKNTFGGYDLFMQYDVDTSFGSIFSSFNGTYLDNAKNVLYVGAESIQNAGVDASRFNATFGLGARIGDTITVQGTLYHVSDYDLSTPAALDQTKVDSWDTVDLYAQYDFPGENVWTENLSLSLGVNNVTDEDPPEYRGVSASNTAGYVGGTLGRVLQVGFNKRF